MGSLERLYQIIRMRIGIKMISIKLGLNRTACVKGGGEREGEMKRMVSLSLDVIIRGHRKVIELRKIQPIGLLSAL